MAPCHLLPPSDASAMPVFEIVTAFLLPREITWGSLKKHQSLGPTPESLIEWITVQGGLGMDL